MGTVTKTSTESLAASARFWDKTAPSYAKKPIDDEEAYHLTLERARAYFSPDAEVLEVGCGTGTTALRLAPSAKRIVATDLSDGMIAIARQKAHAAQVHNVEFLPGTLETSSLRAGAFDVVMAFNLLHLLQDVPAATLRVLELLRPGGVFVSKTPCVGEEGFLVRAVLPILRTIGRAPFVNYLKKDGLRTTISDAGFEILAAEILPERSHNFFIAARKREEFRLQAE